MAAVLPMSMATAMVSPTARPRARKQPPMMPGRAYGDGHGDRRRDDAPVDQRQGAEPPLARVPIPAGEEAHAGGGEDRDRPPGQEGEHQDDDRGDDQHHAEADGVKDLVAEVSPAG